MMVFKPETLDGQAAARKLLAKKVNRPLACLYEVFQIFPFKRSDAPNAYTSARVSWNRTPVSRRHVGDRNMPAGAVVYFKLRIEDGTVDPWPGHICLSLGGNRIVSTDWPTRGRIGATTIDELERKWASNEVEFLGWTDWIGGHNVTTGPDPDAVQGSPAGAAVKYAYEKVALGHVNVRTSPRSGAVIATLDPGTVIKSGKTIAGWTPIKAGKITGWVQGNLAVLRTKAVARSTLVLRDRPAKLGKGGSKRLARLKRGQKVTVLRAVPVDGSSAKAAYWRVRVRVGLKVLTGYVLRKYLK
ncbi:hypothetical protein [Microbacterium sp. LjRoot45]|uniref:hypothetical protein n=1 Tax=Microbacterium sp. LjRoot45 TaxID=3342329 RepID=UPI003F50212F